MVMYTLNNSYILIFRCFLDATSFRKLIVWLESNKIKQADQNTLNSLKNVNSNDWLNVYNRYKNQLGCPTLAGLVEDLQWILGYAVQIETSKNSKSVQ